MQWISLFGAQLCCCCCGMVDSALCPVPLRLPCVFFHRPNSVSQPQTVSTIPDSSNTVVTAVSFLCFSVIQIRLPILFISVKYLFMHSRIHLFSSENSIVLSFLRSIRQKWRRCSVIVNPTCCYYAKMIGFRDHSSRDERLLPDLSQGSATSLTAGPAESSMSQTSHVY